MRLWLILATLVSMAVLASGCRIGPYDAPSATSALGHRPGTAVSPTAAAETTILRIRTRWPEGPGRDLRGYHQQFIPNSTSRSIVMASLFTPAVTSLSFNRGLEGESLQINGSNLAATWANTSVVLFTGAAASVSATVTAPSASQLTVTVPAGFADGSLAIVVDGATTSSTAAFTQLSPEITGATPAEGLEGATVVIDGEDLYLARLGQAGTEVRFPGSAGPAVASIMSASPDQLTVTIPVGAVSGPISVSVGGATTTSASYFQAGRRFVSSISTSMGRVGDTLHFCGNLPSDTTVSFPGAGSVAVSRESSTHSTVVVPAGASSGVAAVMGGGQTIRTFPFDFVGYGVGLGPFGGHGFRDRRNTNLWWTRFAPFTFTSGRWAYAIGGNGVTGIERARLNVDGTIGDFSFPASGVRADLPRRSGGTSTMSAAEPTPSISSMRFTRHPWMRMAASLRGV